MVLGISCGVVCCDGVNSGVLCSSVLVYYVGVVCCAPACWCIPINSAVSSCVLYTLAFLNVSMDT